MSLISSITVETAFLPPILINDPLSGGQGGGGSSAFLALLKPKITVNSPLSSDSYVSAPYGDPGNSWEVIDLVLLAGVAVLGGFLLRRLMR
jgi:hypothetical protein